MCSAVHILFHLITCGWLICNESLIVVTQVLQVDLELKYHHISRSIKMVVDVFGLKICHPY